MTWQAQQAHSSYNNLPSHISSSRHPLPVHSRHKLHPTPTKISAVSGIPDPDLPPYALLSTPVYSLSSQGLSGNFTMNMITYASPIALRPQRKYALGLYVQSLTYQHMKETGRAVLQILQEQHASLFQLLGKTSGRDVDKIHALREQGLDIHTEYGLPVLAGIMELTVASEFIPSGDHEVVVCGVTSWKIPGTAAAKPQPLYTAYLRQQGYL